MSLKESSGGTVGIILLNLGGPDSLRAIKPFLYNLFSDRRIISLGPPFLQKPIARLIATIRSKKTEGMYRLIGGKSPIRETTKEQARALEEAFNRVQGPGKFKVYIGMRYWHPFIDDVIPQIYADGIRKLVAVSLYPQYSVATSGSSISRFEEVAAGYAMETISISSWHNHPSYIDTLVDLIRKGLDSFPPSTFSLQPSASNDIHVLFSAHSLPKKIIDQGDPYVVQTMETIGEITKRIPLAWHLSYQSRSGPVEWLEPSTDEKLEELARKGVRNILVVPISFVSDHIETLYEIDILYKNLADKLGITLKRTDSLNTHQKFIEALKDIVETRLREIGWAKSTG